MGRPQVGFGATGPFVPYKPPPIPTGSYDPALDAQLGAAQRGYGDLQEDVATGDLRAGVDFGLGQDDINRGRDRGLGDIELSRRRAQQDHDLQIEQIQRGYQQLGRRQAEGARQHGVLSGGLALLAAQKRAENEAIDRRPVDIGLGRSLADSSTARTRLGQDADNQLGRLALDFARGGEDRGTALERGGRENTQFGLDVGAVKAFQAAQSGYEAPGVGEPGGRPKNEGVNAKGVPYRDVVQGAWIVRYDQHGNVLSRRLRAGVVGRAGGGRTGLPGAISGSRAPSYSWKPSWRRGGWGG